MTIKKFLSVAMLATLFLTSTAKAMSWNSIKQIVASITDNKKFLIAAAVGTTLIGITSLSLFKWYKAKPRTINANNNNRPTKQEEISIIQIPVLLQQGNAQCGYHALKNAELALEMQNLKQDWNNLDNNNHFLSKQYFCDYITNWKQLTLKNRKKTALKELLQNQLKTYLDKKHPQFQKYREACDNIGSGKAEHYFEIEPINKDYTIETYSVLSILQLALYEKNIEKTTEQIVQDNPKLNDIEFKLSDKSVENTVRKKFNSLDEWLLGNEIGSLLFNQTNRSELREHISIIDDVNQISFVLDDPNDANSLLKKWNSSDNIYHIFIVGTINQQNIQSKGHWFTVVAIKNSGKLTYYTMDSLGTDRTDDGHTKKIINFLAGKSSRSFCPII